MCLFIEQERIVDWIVETEKAASVRPSSCKALYVFA